MRFHRAPLLLALVAGVAATVPPPAHAGGLPMCNAKHKRPANAYGSVLSDGLKPALASASPAAVAPSADAPARPSATRSPAVKPQQVSRAAWRASFAPCGSDRA